MKLSSIKITNIKGRTETLDLDAVHILSGPSRSGKTAVLLGIRWLLTGSMPPPYGKTPKLQWLAAGDGASEMRVDGQMNNGLKAWRKLVKTDGVRVTAYLPDSITVPEMLADPGVFFGLTKQGRIDALFAASGAKKDAERIAELAKEAGVTCELQDGKDPYESAEEFVKAELDLAGWEETNAVQSISKYRELMDTPVAPVTQEELDVSKNTYEESVKALHDFKQPVTDIYRPLPNEVDEAVHWLETVSEADECPCCGCGAAQGWREHAVTVALQRVKEAKERSEASASKEKEFQSESKASSEKWAGLVSAHSEANTAYNALLSRREARSRYEAAGGAMRKAESELLAVRKRAEKLEAFKAALAADKLALLQQASGIIVEVMNRFSKGMIDSPLEFDSNMELGRRVSQADCSAGCKAPIGSWISHRSFSGSEQAVAYTALVVALAAQAPFRIVLIDELGRMDEALRTAVTRRLSELVEQGVIHQFVGALAQ